MLGKVQRGVVHVDKGRDVDIIDASQAGYAEANLLRSVEKSFGFSDPRCRSSSSSGGRAATTFKAWGTSVSSDPSTPSSDNSSVR